MRQALLHLMIDSLGYPKGLIGVEVSLDRIPHLRHKKVPLRRADIIVFSKEFVPQVLVECKSVPLTQSAIQQAIGYNHFVSAPYVVLANSKEIKTGVFEEGEWIFREGLPVYSLEKSWH